MHDICRVTTFWEVGRRGYSHLSISFFSISFFPFRFLPFRSFPAWAGGRRACNKVVKPLSLLILNAEAEAKCVSLRPESREPDAWC